MLGCLCGGILLVVSAGGDDDQEPSGSTTAAPVDEPENAGAGVGTPVRDGKFEFTVTGVKCGVTKVGSDALNEAAQGQFCLVTMNVKNIGDQAQTFDAGSQKAKNASGQAYSADGTASLYANEDTQSFLNQINPGNQVTGGVVVFDIPKDQEITMLELHDSPFSGGVEVSVG